MPEEVQSYPLPRILADDFTEFAEILSGDEEFPGTHVAWERLAEGRRAELAEEGYTAKFLEVRPAGFRHSSRRPAGRRAWTGWRHMWRCWQRTGDSPVLLAARSLQLLGAIWISAVIALRLYLFATDAVVYAPVFLVGSEGSTWLLAALISPGLSMIAVGCEMAFRREDKQDRELR